MLMSTPFSTCTLLDPDPNVLANVFTSSIDAFSSTYETIPLEMHPFVLEMAPNPKKSTSRLDELRVKLSLCVHSMLFCSTKLTLNT